jgi:polyisoprenoid-binding protein YceI
MSTSTIDVAGIPLAGGRWLVDPTASRVGFRARGMWGLAPVRGQFDQLDGSLDVDGRSQACGELRLQVGSLHTGLKLRDRHLLSRDFFDAGRYPELRFRLQGVQGLPGAEVRLTGELVVRDRVVPLTLVGSVRPRSGGVGIAVTATLDREAIGMGRSPLGMIRGPVDVDVTVVLRRSGQEGAR